VTLQTYFMPSQALRSGSLCFYCVTWSGCMSHLRCQHGLNRTSQGGRVHYTHVAAVAVLSSPVVRYNCVRFLVATRVNVATEGDAK